MWVGPRYLWTVEVLHPAGAEASRAYGLDDKQQVGYVQYDHVRHASLWLGRASPWIDLHPQPDYASSVAKSVEKGRQVGIAVIGGREHAIRWTGSAGSFSDLNWNIHSGAYGISGNKIAGWIGGDQSRAALWTIGAPPCDALELGASYSMALGFGDGQQVGYQGPNDVYHYATLWSGTSNSAVSLNPPGCQYSTAYCANGGKQGGFAQVDGSYHASLWSGSAASWIDLNPLAATSSEITGIHQGFEVGTAVIGGFHHACLWTGSTFEWEDLHHTLGPEYDESYAQGVRRVGNYIRVIGWGHNSAANRDEAIMWTRRMPSGSPGK